MRFLNKLGHTLGLFTVAAVAFVLFCPDTANAAPVDGPSGSYRATCKNIKQHGDTLSARCQDQDGRWNDTQLDDIGRCTGEITNIYGHLKCDKVAKEVIRGRAPEGSYAGTCRDIHVDGDRLYAHCKNTSGQWNETYLNDLDRCRGDITNVDGQLRCATREEYRGDDRDRRGPRGSYSESCRDISVRGDALFARCETVNGEWRDSRMDDFRRCGSEVVNDDGRLECTRRDGWSAPHGTYTETCREIYLRGDSMRARCKTEDGHWTWTQLDDWDHCREGIVNINGQLRCAQ